MQVKPERTSSRKFGGTLYLKLPAWWSKQLDLDSDQEFWLIVKSEKEFCVEKIEDGKK